MLASSASAQDDRVYRRTIDEALDEFGAAHWEEARVLFQEAHARFPNARTLRGIGMASFELRDYVDAYLTLGEALDSEVRPLPRRMRAQTVALRERAASFLGHLYVETVPTDASVTLDLEPVMPDRQGNIYVNSGDHSLAVEAEGYEPQTLRFTVEGGEGKHLRVVLHQIPPPPPPPPPPEPSPWPWILLPTAGAFVAATSIGLGWYVNRKNEADKCAAADADPMFRCTNLGTLAGQRDGALGFTLAMATVALAAGITGLVLFFTDDARDEEPGEAAALCMPGLGAVVCAGRF